MRLDNRRIAKHDHEMSLGLMVNPALLLILAGLGCQAEKSDCYAGYVADGAGGCVVEGEAHGDDTDAAGADTGTNGHSADPADEDDTGGVWLELGPCTAPEALPTDPIVELGSLSSIEEGAGPSPVFMELVQVQLDPGREMLWGVGQGGLFGFDISDPSVPVLVSQSPDGGHGRYYNLWVFGADDPGAGLIYTTHRDIGLWVIDTDDLDAPDNVYTWGRAGLAGMSVVENHLYIAKHSGDVQILDISERSSPVEVGTVSGMSVGWTVVAGDGVLYGGDNVEGVVVFDLSDPHLPIAERSIDVGGGVQALAVSGDTLFAAAGSAGVVSLDISDPLHPVWLDTWAAGASVQDVAVDGDTLWAVTQASVIAIDVSDPSVLAPVSSRETPFWAMAVDAGDGAAWVGDWGAVRGYARTPDIAAPDLSLGASELLLSDTANTITVPIINRGSADLHLVGLESDEAGLSASVNQMTVAPGAQASMRIHWSGGALDAEICIASDDPDRPIQTLKVHVGSGGGVGAVGTVAPDFVLTDLDGVHHRLSEMVGHPVVLVYFATW